MGGEFADSLGFRGLGFRCLGFRAEGLGFRAFEGLRRCLDFGFLDDRLPLREGLRT